MLKLLIVTDKVGVMFFWAETAYIVVVSAVSICNATIIPRPNIHPFIDSSSNAGITLLRIAPGLRTIQFLFLLYVDKWNCVQ
jgi:hypothetical protein